MIKSLIGVVPILPKDEVAERLTDMGNKKQLLTNDTAKQRKKLSIYAHLLMNTTIRRWHDNVARGSILTAEVRVRRLHRFCEITGKTPMEVAELGMNDLRTMTDLVLL